MDSLILFWAWFGQSSVCKPLSAASKVDGKPADFMLEELIEHLVTDELKQKAAELLGDKAFESET